MEANSNWTTQKLPWRWMPPEMNNKNPETSLKVDIYSFGCLIYEALNHGERPFPGASNTSSVSSHLVCIIQVIS